MFAATVVANFAIAGVTGNVLRPLEITVDGIVQHQPIALRCVLPRSMAMAERTEVLSRFEDDCMAVLRDLRAIDGNSEIDSQDCEWRAPALHDMLSKNGASLSGASFLSQVGHLASPLLRCAYALYLRQQNDNPTAFVNPLALSIFLVYTPRGNAIDTLLAEASKSIPTVKPKQIQQFYAPAPKAAKPIIYSKAMKALDDEPPSTTATSSSLLAAPKFSVIPPSQPRAASQRQVMMDDDDPSPEVKAPSRSSAQIRSAVSDAARKTKEKEREMILQADDLASVQLLVPRMMESQKNVWSVFANEGSLMRYRLIRAAVKCNRCRHPRAVVIAEGAQVNVDQLNRIVDGSVTNPSLRSSYVCGLQFDASQIPALQQCVIEPATCSTWTLPTIRPAMNFKTQAHNGRVARMFDYADHCFVCVSPGDDLQLVRLTPALGVNFSMERGKGARETMVMCKACRSRFPDAKVMPPDVHKVNKKGNTYFESAPRASSSSRRRGKKRPASPSEEESVDEDDDDVFDTSYSSKAQLHAAQSSLVHGRMQVADDPLDEDDEDDAMNSGASD